MHLAVKLYAIFMKHLLMPVLVFTLYACGQNKSKPDIIINSTAGDTIESQITSMSNYMPTIDKAHPNAKRLMNEEFYWSSIEESAPFGNDDGADTYASFADWRRDHKGGILTTFLEQQINYWGYPEFDLKETNLEKLVPYLKESDMASRYMSGIDAAIVAIAFGQLYLEGKIDKGFNELAQIAIKRQLIPKLLQLWGNDYMVTRQSQLQIMLRALEQAP